MSLWVYEYMQSVCALSSFAAADAAGVGDGNGDDASPSSSLLGTGSDDGFIFGVGGHERREP